MKIQKIIALFVVLAASCILGASTYAAEPTFVSGTVHTPNGTPIEGASVHVVCNLGDKRYDLTTLSNTNGTYIVKFDENNCFIGKMVEVTAVKNSVSGFNSGEVKHFPLGNGISLDIAIVNVAIPIPEFGVIAGVMTTLASTGFYMSFRKRS